MASETCDRCGEATLAYDLWMNEDGLMLTACRHHGRQWQILLRDLGFWLMEAREVPA